jgi:hypothetical protein
LKKRHKADHAPDTRGGRLACIPHCVLKSEAYRHLSPMERAALYEIVLRVSGYSNGLISLSVRELADRFNRKKMAPFADAVAKLMAHGLIDVTTDGSWRPRAAREFRLTFFNTTDKVGRRIAATNDYLLPFVRQRRDLRRRRGP